ncbi:MAG: 50S ribosomal protein L17 [Flavobacteriales bacterium]|jgi:large subunit ribosomal protein L17
MRHGKKDNHLGRKSAHRSAMLMNMANSLILHKRIKTTVAKAKELRKFVEPILTKAKTDSTHERRQAFSILRDKNVVTELFRDVAVKIADRPGGYTRIIKIGNRLGDNAEMALIELVDYNENLLSTGKTSAGSKRRTRRGAKKAEGTPAPAKAEAKSEAVETPVAEEIETPVAEVVETPVAEAPTSESTETSNDSDSTDSDSSAEEETK